jgi:hypothetical protein
MLLFVEKILSKNNQAASPAHIKPPYISMLHYKFGKSFGRFSRARGCSLFARAMNSDLPRGLRHLAQVIPGGVNFGENPLMGFAETKVSGLSVLRLQSLIEEDEVDEEVVGAEESVLFDEVCDVKIIGR